MTEEQLKFWEYNQRANNRNGSLLLWRFKILKNAGFEFSKIDSNCKKKMVEIRPDLKMEWNFKRNTNLNIDNVLYRSIKKVWWKCKFGHEWQSAISHRTNLKNPTGCPICSGNLKSNIHIFIKKSKQIHGNKYDYSESKYNGAFNKLTIICKIHGKFLQTPGNHYKGKGCRKCADIQRWIDRRKKFGKSGGNNKK